MVQMDDLKTLCLKPQLSPGIGTVRPYYQNTIKHNKRATFLDTCFTYRPGSRHSCRKIRALNTK